MNSVEHAEHNHHDASHQCQYCTVYGNLVLPPDLELKAVLDRIQVRLIAFQKALRMFGLHCNNFFTTSRASTATVCINLDIFFGS
jgi:hypothetical protein